MEDHVISGQNTYLGVRVERRRKIFSFQGAFLGDRFSVRARSPLSRYVQLEASLSFTLARVLSLLLLRNSTDLIVLADNGGCVCGVMKSGVTVRFYSGFQSIVFS